MYKNLINLKNGLNIFLWKWMYNFKRINEI